MYLRSWCRWFMRGRGIYPNVWHCRPYWDPTTSGFLLSVDFEKAYNTVTFEHALIMFELLGLPVGIISLMSGLLQAPILFDVQGAVVSIVVWAQGVPRCSP